MPKWPNFQTNMKRHDLKFVESFFKFTFSFKNNTQAVTNDSGITNCFKFVQSLNVNALTGENAFYKIFLIIIDDGMKNYFCNLRFVLKNRSSFFMIIL